MNLLCLCKKKKKEQNSNTKEDIVKQRRSSTNENKIPEISSSDKVKPTPEPDQPKPPPLQNKGEICYMNSIIQAFGSCVKMNEALKTLGMKYKSNKLKLFIKLLDALNSKSAQLEFNEFISSYGWAKQGQQDSFEMMVYFINLIYDEVKIEEMEKQKKDRDEFNAHWKSLVLPCRINMNSRTNCECESDNKNILNDIALHLPLVNDGVEGNTKYDINDMISCVLREDSIDDNCDKCGAPQTVIISLDGLAPKTLCFHVQANRMDYMTGNMVKPKYILDFPFKLTVQNQDYDLVSFVDHSGGVTVGHYIAYRRCGEHWFSVNDNSVTQLESANTPSEYCMKPYVLFYEQSDLPVTCL